MDLNHTALTELQNRLTTVEGSVESLASSTYGHTPSVWRSVKNENITTSSFVDVINVTGSGRLHLVTTDISSHREWKVTIDGVSTCVEDIPKYDRDEVRSILVDTQFLIGVDDGSTQTSYRPALLNIHGETINQMAFLMSPGYVYLSSSGSERDTRLVTTNLGSDCTKPTWFITKGGVPFNNNLRVQCRSADGRAVSCYVCYSLN